MPKSTTALATPLREQLDRLAAFEPTSWLVLSVYLDLRADQQGQEQYAPFLRKTLRGRAAAIDQRRRDPCVRGVRRLLRFRI